MSAPGRLRGTGYQQSTRIEALPSHDFIHGTRCLLCPDRRQRGGYRRRTRLLGTLVKGIENADQRWQRRTGGDPPLSRSRRQQHSATHRARAIDGDRRDRPALALENASCFHSSRTSPCVTFEVCKQPCAALDVWVAAGEVGAVDIAGCPERLVPVMLVHRLVVVPLGNEVGVELTAFGDRVP